MGFDMASQDGIKNVLEGLLAGIHADNEQLFDTVAATPVVKDAVGKVSEGDLDGFYFALLYPLSNMVDGLLERELPLSREAQFLFKHSTFVESHFRRLIEKFEGSACCADKSRTILAKLLRFFNTGAEVSFDYTQKYTYHLPTKVFTTHHEILGFFAALQSLLFGRGEPYVAALGAIYTRMAEAGSATGSTGLSDPSANAGNAALRSAAPAASSPDSNELALTSSVCADDGGKCGAGGYCDICPHRTDVKEPNTGRRPGRALRQSCKPTPQAGVND
ncbi:hypothetical protein F6X40_27950 [Paraburkholderia sp. UCT31]|uniref:hypothetical protein n=1 Tax=Paraburkholderia sp. UCT31 TaxID=2615209 RepID=UPI0016561DE7|nr:hypothetical protein [Paraburkholderia sp. UCT31]MBC8740474.1 hypothetical protein [Paraburkholderia sp. UCT31]